MDLPFDKKYLGYAAAILTTVAFLPQAVEVYQTNDTKSLSLATYTIYLLGLVMWMVYGFIDEDYPIAYSSIVSIIIAAYLLFKIISNSRGMKKKII